ncbi:hypothetical protein ACG74X_17975 [Marivita sp. S0852]|uniref:hypothetical protein n=1 Tax=Marivita sp. S0852 TaxID=3373893 RepID=UPI003981D044
MLRGTSKGLVKRSADNGFDLAGRQVALARACHPVTRDPGLMLPLRKDLQVAMWNEMDAMRSDSGLTRRLTRVAKIL